MSRESTMARRGSALCVAALLLAPESLLVDTCEAQASGSAGARAERTAVLEARPSNPTSRPEYGFVLTYRWRAAPMDGDYKAFVHVVDRNERIVLQDDHAPPTPTSRWSGRVEYERTIPVRVGVPEGEYAILVGLYDKGGRQALETGRGVTGDPGRRYRVATLRVDAEAPLPELGPATLDLRGYRVTFNEDFDDLSVSA